MKAPYVSPQRPSCECPGCGATVQVTLDGTMYEHLRDLEWSSVVNACGWSGKPAPTVDPAKTGWTP